MTTHRTTLSLLALAFSLAAAPAPAPPIKTPPLIDLSKAPAPLFDDPLHGATDPFVLWNPVKNAYFMYYTQRRASLQPANGVDWVHGSKIGIASSPDGVTWTYLGTCQGDHNLTDPLSVKDAPGGGVTWWAPCFLYDPPTKTFHMFVTLVDGIYTRWTGNRNIVHFTSDDGISWKYAATAKLSSDRVIDPTVYKVPNDDNWYMVYKDEAAGSRTFRAQSKDLNTWTNPVQVSPEGSQEAPFVFHWKNQWWMIVDALGDKGLRMYTSDNGLDHWTHAATLLAAPDGKRPKDNNVGHHPGILLQGGPNNDDQCLLFYFTHQGKNTVMQLAEIELGPDGKPFCNRNKFAAAPASKPASKPAP